MAGWFGRGVASIARKAGRRARPAMAALLFAFAAPAAAMPTTPIGAEAVAEAFAGPRRDGEARILFIGNSFTRDHDIPARVTALAAERGRSVRAGLLARSGAWLADHAMRPAVRGLVARIDWDLVILQDHSVAALSPAGAERSRRAAEALAALAPREVLLFETWPRAEGHPLFRRAGMPRGPAEMAARVSAHYRALAAGLGARVAPVGRAFLAAEAPLHGADGYHASRAGAAFAARILADAILEALEGAAPR